MILGKPKYYFFIDIVAACNLKCPTCAVANSASVANSRGIMQPSLLSQILEKAVSECSVEGVGLFNWGEPLLHPRLDDMVRIVNKFGIRCSIGTNLNIKKPEFYRKLLAANPAVLRVSLSGFSQEKYDITHKGGKIEDVKRNLKLLVDIKREIRVKTYLTVSFHRYLTNLDEENAMKEFCESMGISFRPIYARMGPMEKVLAFCGDMSFSSLTPEDGKTIDNLLLPLKDALASAASIISPPCKLREEQIVLNWKGDALLCCAIYDEKHFFVGNYLETGLKQLQSTRRRHEGCAKCVENGISNYYLSRVPEADGLVVENIRRRSEINSAYRSISS